MFPVSSCLRRETTQQVMAECPHCQESIDPPPLRSRKCPHCRTLIVVRRGQLLTTEAANKLDERLAADEARERFRSGQQNAAREIREARKSGVVAGFQPLVSTNDCNICQAVRSMVFPVATCTPEMLPPYRNCELPDGCRATFTSVLTAEYEGLLAQAQSGTALEPGQVQSPKSRSGCLSMIIAAGTLVLSSIIAWVACTI